MKYSADQQCISSFFVGTAGSKRGVPVAVIFLLFQGTDCSAP
ncbi:hypothetical protein SAMN02746065_107145 [Desulfocicer vacuolatum DSM 3385]|uniref:Uncharacterized protein n=1 Tax=Desulfocicer vacuolatum DSM 3385 TaxID=1121400 RepID=A0A1W2B9I1_9BACT|nr:hypothetical protein [Desulfocicer vacuolatum]SMC69440.1 hypothetical protein SAMN02746065_107145 [Desulfocicer vacuolatum DSM 3385]